MKNKISEICFFAMTLLLVSCQLQKGFVKYEVKQDEIIATEKIKSFTKNNPKPSIVLRVPETQKLSTQADPNNYIYNAIEKELVLAGFNVKDRGLFNEVVNRSESLDYSKLKELTGTELILELVRLDVNIKHTTNRIYTKSGTEKISEYSQITRPGAAIEFKLIIVEGNDYGGSYSFFYTPCTEINYHDDCKCFVGYKNFPNKVYPQINLCDVDKNVAFEYVDQNVMENFVRNGVKLMAHEIYNEYNPTFRSEGITKESNKATVITEQVEDIAYYSVKLNGNVTSDGGSPVLSRGFCYSSTNQEPLFSDNNVKSGTGAGNFSATINNLSSKIKYYYRAYAINSLDTSYGSVVEFITSKKLVYDFDRNSYPIVEIGTQIWMSENLKTSKLNDGTPILLIADNKSWETSKKPAYCWYANQPNNEKVYGDIYNWYAVSTGKLCPTGWHVPSDVDFNVLEVQLGGTNLAGGKMKEIGLKHWLDPNTSSTNSSEFNGLPGGRRYDVGGGFFDLGKYGFYWTTSDKGNEIIVRYLNYTSGSLESGSALKETGASVRCIKDN